MNLLRFCLMLLSMLISFYSYADAKKQNLVIMYEYGTAETVQKSLRDEPSSRYEEDRPSGIGAATGMLLTALYQESAPILVPLPLWQNIVSHKKIFDSFVSLDTASLYKRYGTHPRFQGRKVVAQFKELCVYMHTLYQSLMGYVQSIGPEELEKSLWRDPVFDKKNAPLALRDPQSPWWQELHMYLMCSAVPISHYVVKKIVENQRGPVLYLFIPKKLQSECHGHACHGHVCQGLAWHDLPDADHLFQEDSPVNTKGYDTALVPALRHLIKSKHREEHEWVFYMLGHGSFSNDAHQKIKLEERELERWQEAQSRYEKEEKEWKQTYAHLNDQITQHAIRKRRDSYYGAMNFRFEDTLRRNREISEKNVALCKEQAAISAKNVAITQANIESLNNANTIAGISVGQFTTLLHLFNTHCRTRLFFYASCSAGGKHFVDAYHDPVTYKPLELAYTVMSDALTEAPSSSVCPAMDLRYYTDNRNRHYYHVQPHKLIDWQTKSITCDSCYNFGDFFNAAHAQPNVDSISILLKSVTPVCLPGRQNRDGEESTMIRWVRKGCTVISTWCKKIKHAISGTPSRERVEHTDLKNLPSVRLKKSHHFRVINLNDAFFSVNARFVKKNKGLNISIPDTIDAVFLYTPSLVNPVLIAGRAAGYFPAIISMIPGNASHVLAELDASQSCFSEIVQSFFAIPKLFTTKIIHIKKLTCMNDLCIKEVAVGSPYSFSDVILFNRFSLSAVTEQKVNGVIVNAGKKSYVICWDADASVPTDLAYRCVAAQASQSRKLLEACAHLRSIVSESTSQDLITLDDIARTYA